MTILDAYLKAREKSDKKILVACVDLGSEWAFNFRSSMLVSDPIIYGGIHYYTVNKYDGEIGTLSSRPEDIEIIANGINVDTNQFRDEERKILSSIEKVVSKVLYHQNRLKDR